MSSEESIVVFADSHETDSVISELEKLCAVKKLRLFCGDYICSDRAIIERKTESDFAISIADGRLFRQLNALRICRKPILLIEADGFPQSGMHPNAIWGALASIVLDFNIPVLYSRSCADTVGIIFHIARREQIELKKSTAFMRHKNSKTDSSMQEQLISGLPGVNAVLAKRLLAQFKTPQEVFSATEEELQRVNGIGSKRAKQIFDLLRGESPQKAEES